MRGLRCPPDAVFVTDFRSSQGLEGHEGLVALDQLTGRPLWSRRWPVDYAGIAYAAGPRATPTVDGDRVYALGAAGSLVCARVLDGRVVWERSFPRDFGTELPPWGMASAPLVHGDLLIAVVYGRPAAKVVAFDKVFGRGSLAGTLVREFRSGILATDPLASRGQVNADRLARGRPCGD